MRPHVNTSVTRADAIVNIINAELAVQRERLNAEGPLHAIHVTVQLSERNGRPFKVRMNLETERVIC